MTILLAPMEGLLDCTLRDALTQVGGVQRCVSEFIRVTDQLLPLRSFTRVAPELLNGGFTPAGVPLRPQLLGSDPACLAENAARLAAISPHGVDLNFGCPAKTVNRHRGGAVLLDAPQLLHDITAAVRRAVPAHLPVSAKMRLGYMDDARAIECAQALAAGGAGEIVVHARTRAQGYRPPAHWERVADIRASVAVPVVANGPGAANCRRRRAALGGAAAAAAALLARCVPARAAAPPRRAAQAVAARLAGALSASGRRLWRLAPHERNRAHHRLSRTALTPLLILHFNPRTSHGRQPACPA